MRPALLLAIFGGLALAAPLAVSPDGSHLVARSENAVAARDAEPEVTAVEDRQLSPGGLGNIDWNGLIDQVKTTLDDTTSLTTAQIKTIVGIITGISQGKPLDGSVIGKLLTIPASLLVKLPQILAPILVPATMGLPGVNQAVYMLLVLLQTLGGGVGLLGGLTGGLGGLLGRAVPGVNIDQVLAKVSSALKNTGLSEGQSDIVGGIVRGLLEGTPLGSGAFGQLQSIPTQALSKVIGALNTVIWQIPAIGPLLAPLLALLQLVILSGGNGGLLGGLLGVVNNASGGVPGGKNGAIGGLLGGIL
ncbi:hypothetical protein CC85DRAFT_320585 [Cutaneotrichosporon oleaginosum]|uniref:Uncharacterized protein n=1 Tax=Cutaneotrichosporon oleaginosum TaxID=879819 RepID=A0A0J0XJ68_9TREE|nr:uncharacterized protein CC85DRAFT_320585 [Cutaneotrichosporon oleaginosum]KLT41106.1 hypothetical protein CC85DRAFT_320585 [Cutaneotrichosporon oleaginosum]TXT05762.1 hypothetical protein COLE_07082 [Cutaneotrichosporon oleaginosum]